MIHSSIERELGLTYVGGPTAILEVAGLRLITDPTFDSAGSEYPTKVYVLRKTDDPAVTPDDIGPVDAVLLSHDHHADNLDLRGRASLAAARRVITTAAGAERLQGSAIGLAPWESVEVPCADGRTLVITATPARHGPADGDRGPVIGFAIAFADSPRRVVYVSGDTVWYDGVADVARRFDVRLAVLFMGAARVAAVGPAHLTMTATEGVEAARAFADADIVPLHFEGWEHFSQGRDDIAKAFAAAGMEQRLVWPAPGTTKRSPMA
jgi:L-ascorbate metabolism protein UlaG (beta-lactamase superfamily)